MSEALPLGEWVDSAVKFVVDNDGGTLERMGSGIGTLTEALEIALQAAPMSLITALLVAVGFWRVGWKFALFCLACCYVIDATGFWPQTMVTLALIVAATVISLVLGLPLGIWAARSDRVAAIVRPTLDFMQTMPAFVYLIPAAMLFGLGRVPGVLATVIFAMPPVVRLTSLGIRQVNKEQVEAGVTFGCTPLQVLFKVQIPGAMPSIMAGINQTIMMALGMVVIASMIGVQGLGLNVLQAIANQYFTQGIFNGFAIVGIAIIFDRISQAYGQRLQKHRGSAHD
jgi:glycine betaine/proline transport system permease protein